MRSPETLSTLTGDARKRGEVLLAGYEEAHRVLRAMQEAEVNPKTLADARAKRRDAEAAWDTFVLGLQN